MQHQTSHDRRWIALIVLCLGVLMIVLDTTIVNVALPSVKQDLGFDETSLAWVVNAYMLTFGGFLLLGGRLGDLFGHRKLFLLGIVLFTLASLLCGIANTQTLLIGARAAQGFGGAIVSAVALSLIMTLFSEPGEGNELTELGGGVQQAHLDPEPPRRQLQAREQVERRGVRLERADLARERSHLPQRRNSRPDLIVRPMSSACCRRLSTR